LSLLEQNALLQNRAEIQQQLQVHLEASHAMKNTTHRILKPQIQEAHRQSATLGVEHPSCSAMHWLLGHFDASTHRSTPSAAESTREEKVQEPHKVVACVNYANGQSVTVVGQPVCAFFMHYH
jgi:hypothetical protein